MREPTRPILKIGSLLLLCACGLLTSQGYAQTGTTDARTCVATAAAPTYTEGTRNPLSCDLTGLLRSSATSSGADGAILDGVSAAIKATVFDFTNSNPLGVVLRDLNGDYIAVPNTAAQGTVATDTDQLSMSGCVRADTAAVATGVIDGDRARCIVDATGRMWVHVGTIDGGTITSITNPVTVTQATAANLNAQVQGAAASGAAKAGNPVQIGGVFNTTQPTVTTGQAVEAQATARGAQIVAPGVDGFAVSGTVTTTPPSNASTNVTQFGSNNVATGTGTGGVGIPRVTVSNDSNVLATQSGTWTVQPGNTANTAPWLTESIKVASANNAGACPSGAANTTALASNASRRGAYLAASSANTDDIFLKLGATATSSNFRLAPGQSFNILTGSIYTGVIDFLPASGTQAVCVAEMN